MTWAKNFGDRDRAGSFETGKRAKAVEKLCAGGCGAGIEKRKTYCGPCYDIRLQENIEKNRAKYKVAVSSKNQPRQGE
jgi:hypothetical protein